MLHHSVSRAIRYLKVLACLYAEKVLPCLAKLREVYILNSVQSTLQRTLSMLLKTLG